jgi:radical SAM/Cys-rich protein
VNAFEEAAGRGEGICCAGISMMQVNLGLKCNETCIHCHVEASPDRQEVMDWETMFSVLGVLDEMEVGKVDLTGGAPELNPHFKVFVTALCERTPLVQVRTNLTALALPKTEDLPRFLAERRVRLVASLPCYTAENVRAQRGDVFEASIAVLRTLNEYGYASRGGPELDLVHNPCGAFLPGPQDELEADYRRELGDRHGVRFSHLITITNMPIGRFANTLEASGRADEYGRALKEAFNPATVDTLMCRHQLEIGWDGTLFDCDFNLALRLPVDHGAPSHISRFDAHALVSRRIVTGEHCFGCTAGAGSSCAGALA